MSMNTIADLLINACGKSSLDRRVDPIIDWAVYYAVQQYDDFRAASQRGGEHRALLPAARHRPHSSLRAILVRRRPA